VYVSTGLTDVAKRGRFWLGVDRRGRRSSDVRTWPRRDVSGLGSTDEDVSLLRGMDCDILSQGLIGLTEYSYHQVIPSFPKVHLQRTPGLSVLGSEQFQDG
jgi:hypothetical protein